MAHTPTRDYISRKFDQLKLSIEKRDAALGSAVIDSIRADGYGDLADKVAAGLVAVGIENTIRQMEEGLR